jgi:hypothetical protein
LLVVMLFVSGSAFAAINQPDPSCQNPQIITHTTYSRVFAGPKVGWLNVPAQEETVVCAASK